MTPRARIAKRWLWLFGLILGGGFFIFGGTWLACGGVSYILALRDAQAAYRASRPDSYPSASYEFAAHGILHGMTEQEVEGVLQQKRSTCTMAMEERVGDKMVQWDGFVRLYICEYGKSWHNRLLGRDEILVEEWFWVYFDPSGRAKKVLREVHGGIDSGAMVINLEKKRISRTGH